MRTNLFFSSLVCLFLFLSAQDLGAQAQKYPDFMKYYFPENTSQDQKESFVSELISTSGGGEELIKELDDYYKQYFNYVDNRQTVFEWNQLCKRKAHKIGSTIARLEFNLQEIQRRMALCGYNCDDYFRLESNLKSEIKELDHRYQHESLFATTYYKELQKMDQKLEGFEKKGEELKKELSSYASLNSAPVK